jgi:hypothetical protein
VNGDRYEIAPRDNPHRKLGNNLLLAPGLYGKAVFTKLDSPQIGSKVTAVDCKEHVIII